MVSSENIAAENLPVAGNASPGKIDRAVSRYHFDGRRRDVILTRDSGVLPSMAFLPSSFRQRRVGRKNLTDDSEDMLLVRSIKQPGRTAASYEIFHEPIWRHMTHKSEGGCVRKKHGRSESLAKLQIALAALSITALRASYAPSCETARSWD